MRRSSERGSYLPQTTGLTPRAKVKDETMGRASGRSAPKSAYVAVDCEMSVLCALRIGGFLCCNFRHNSGRPPPARASLTICGLTKMCNYLRP